MNLVGKIFTVLILLMCVVFGTFALMVHAPHTNWKEQAALFNGQLTQANQKAEDLKQEKANQDAAWRDEQARAEKRIAFLKEERQKVVEQQLKDQKEIDDWQRKARTLALAIQEVHKRLTVLQTGIDALQTDLKKTVDDRNVALSELVKKTDDVQNISNEKDRLDKLNREGAGLIIKLKQLIEITKVSFKDMLKLPPELEGEVTRVPSQDAVEISVGADDGVRKGHRFNVFRPSAGGKYIGKIEVIQAEFGNLAVCRPDKKFMLDQIQRGDHVKADVKPR